MVKRYSKRWSDVKWTALNRTVVPCTRVSTLGSTEPRKPHPNYRGGLIDVYREALKL